MTFANEHRLRARILGEIHSRPFHPLHAPRRLFHFAFLVSPDESVRTREAFLAFCNAHAVPLPPPDAKQHRVSISGQDLTFETHGEFITLTFGFAGDHAPFTPAPAQFALPLETLVPSGQLLVAVDLHLVKTPRPSFANLFDETSLAAAIASRGKAVIATDFRADQHGFVRILICDEGMNEKAAGALVQRALEIETYRMLALLGLPEAQRVAPAIARIEQALPTIMSAMKAGGTGAEANALLDDITTLAAELEAGAAESQFRFGATRAYATIMQSRFAAIHEEKLEHFSQWSSFLDRRFSPALRTCMTLEERQANLSRKLSRAAQLLRTRVDLDIEKQNQQLLAAMNERSRLSLQMQQTVEGLSVAAISYYCIGLIGYAAKGLEKAGHWLEPNLVTALSVPFVLAGVWLFVRRVHRKFGSH